jgi:hypothetical protein
MILLPVSVAQPPYQSGSFECPPHQALDPLLDLGSLYIGEVHGTAETPQLVECIIERAVRTKKNVIVSLELPSSAQSPNAPFWSKKDGRASQAMWVLLRSLLAMQHDGKLAVKFQEGPNDSRTSHFDKKVGAQLRDLSEHGYLIAYGGNFHAMRTTAHVADKASPVLATAADFVGKNVHLVRIEAVRGGSAWMCLAQKPCGPEPVPPSPVPEAAAGHVVDGGAYGYDKVYFVDQYSASAPHNLNNDESKGGASALETERDQLLRMLKSDQSIRKQLEHPSAGAKNADLIEMSKRQAAIDEDNLAQLASIVAKSGWPKLSVVGTRGSLAAFLVLQHAPLAQQIKYLPMIKQRYQEGEISGQYLALLEDRVLVRQGKPQRYGTQVEFDLSTRSRELYPIANLETVDVRRKEMGMPSLQTYMKVVGVTKIAHSTH